MKIVPRAMADGLTGGRSVEALSVAILWIKYWMLAKLEMMLFDLIELTSPTQLQPIPFLQKEVDIQ